MHAVYIDLTVILTVKRTCMPLSLYCVRYLFTYKYTQIIVSRTYDEASSYYIALTKVKRRRGTPLSCEMLLNTQYPTRFHCCLPGLPVSPTKTRAILHQFELAVGSRAALVCVCTHIVSIIFRVSDEGQRNKTIAYLLMYSVIADETCT